VDCFHRPEHPSWPTLVNPSHPTSRISIIGGQPNPLLGAVTPVLAAAFIKKYESQIVTAALSLISGILLVFILPAAGRRVKAILAWMSRRVRTEHHLNRRYLNNLAFDLRQLKLLGMANPRDLEQVFVPLRIQGLSSSTRRGAEPVNVTSYPSLQQALASHPRMVILGEPGAGKTSLTNPDLSSGLMAGAG
jgi:hypothetical protein